MGHSSTCEGLSRSTSVASRREITSQLCCRSPTRFLHSCSAPACHSPTPRGAVNRKSRAAAVVAASPPGNNSSFPGNNSSDKKEFDYEATSTTIVTSVLASLLAAAIIAAWTVVVGKIDFLQQLFTPPTVTANAPETLSPKILRQALKKSEARYEKAVIQEEALAKKKARKIIESREAAAQASYKQGRLAERAAIEKAAVAAVVELAEEQGKAAVEMKEQAAKK